METSSTNMDYEILAASGTALFSITGSQLMDSLKAVQKSAVFREDI